MTYHAKIIAGGKMVIPAEIRRALGLGDGDIVVVELDGERLVVRSRLQALREMQANVRKALKRPFTLDDYLAEKWAEADAENGQ